MTTDTSTHSRRHPADRNVLFWAERDPAFYVGITGLSSLLIAPLILLAPGMFVFGLLFLGLSNLVAAQSSRFEVTGAEVRWRNSFWWPTLRIPLAEAADVADFETLQALLPQRLAAAHARFEALVAPPAS